MQAAVKVNAVAKILNKIWAKIESFSDFIDGVSIDLVPKWFISLFSLEKGKTKSIIRELANVGSVDIGGASIYLYREKVVP